MEAGFAICILSNAAQKFFRRERGLSHRISRHAVG